MCSYSKGRDNLKLVLTIYIITKILRLFHAGINWGGWRWKDSKLIWLAQASVVSRKP